MFKTKNILRTLVASVAVAAAAVAPSAYAAPAFEVNVNNLGLTTSPHPNFVATELIGGSAARIVQTAPGQYTATGYINYTSFKNGAATVLANQSYLNFDYGLYATFEQKFQCPGALTAGGASCFATDIDLFFYADAFSDGVTSFGAATLAANPAVNPLGVQHLLGEVHGVFAGVAGIDLLGGAYQNAIAPFQLSAVGAQFFVQPIDFYKVAFSSFTNIGSATTCNTVGCVAPTVVAINEEIGNTVFAGQPVPEPGPLALIGLGLLGLVAARRTKKAA